MIQVLNMTVGKVERGWKMVFFICRTEQTAGAGATGNLLLINGVEGIIARLAADVARWQPCRNCVMDARPSRAGLVA
jgi:hypothetical protein